MLASERAVMEGSFIAARLDSMLVFDCIHIATWLPGGLWPLYALALLQLVNLVFLLLVVYLLLTLNLESACRDRLHLQPHSIL